MDALHRGKWKKKKEICQYMRYKITLKGLQVVMEEVKKRIKAKVNRVNRYSKRKKQFEQNKLFHANQKDFFRKQVRLDG